MKRTAAVLIFAASVAAAQSTKFEAADVHLSGSATAQFYDINYLPGGRFQARSATLVDLIAAAYKLERESVVGGPAWLDNDRFDINAKAPPASTEDERAAMLKALLAERFALKAHADSRAMDVFALTVAKRGAQLKESSGGNADCEPDQSVRPLNGVICVNMTVQEFGTTLRQFANAYLTKQVADMTGLKGRYDFALKWSPRQARPTNADGDAVAKITLFEALEKQLGLKLDPVKQPMPVVVVESVNREPTANAPGVTSKLPKAATEFEAAEIKQNKSGGTSIRIEPKPGGRIEVENAPLKVLIGLAWNYDFGDLDRIVGLPKWAETDRFNIVAKTQVLPGAAPPPFDDLKVMVQSLLIERFGIKAHTEEQPSPVYVLQVRKGGHKLREADASNRSTCKHSATDIGTGSAAGRVSMKSAPTSRWRNSPSNSTTWLRGTSIIPRSMRRD
jgi:uncharacterized protein (TIGR03435 family)